MILSLRGVYLSRILLKISHNVSPTLFSFSSLKKNRLFQLVAPPPHTFSRQESGLLEIMIQDGHKK